MKKLHVYDVYCDDGMSCIKVTIPAESKKRRMSPTLLRGLRQGGVSCISGSCKHECREPFRPLKPLV